MKLDTFFDKIFYINLDKDIDRNNNMLFQFEKYGISNYQRISATKLDRIPEQYLWRNFNSKGLNDKYILGSLGCRNSHWRIMQLSIERGYNRIMVLEDDVIIKENPSHILNENLHLLDNWDMLYFGGTEEKHFGGQIVGGYAYALNKKLIEETYYMLPFSGMELDNFYAKIIYHMSYNYSNTGKYLVKKLSPFNTIEVDYSYPSNIR